VTTKYLAKDDSWFRLDNAAKIYPAVKGSELTSVFRVSVELKKRVKARPLLDAVAIIEDRFPFYKVRLKTGFFWYYLERYNAPIKVVPDIGMPCRAFNKDELMFRVLVKDNRISAEFSHILTDGAGAFEFLKILLKIYFDKCLIHGTSNTKSIGYENEILEENYEDAYKRYFKKIKSPTIKGLKAFHIPFNLKLKPRFDLLKVVIPLDKINNRAKAFNLSLTEYLVAVYIYSLQEVYKLQSDFNKRRSHKNIRIQVPVNLRKIFPSKTMRNFSLFVMPGIDLRLGYFTFDEIAKVVHHQMQLETDKKLINKTISRNVGGEKIPLVRAMPLFFKSVFLSGLYRSATKQYSGVVTNYGKMQLPSYISKQINFFVLIPPPPNKILKINCGAIGFENKLVLSFGNITVSKELERHFFSLLVKHGVPVKIIK